MKIYLSFIFIFMLALGCSNSNLFSPSDDDKNLNPINGPSGQTIIETQVTGGFAGVNWQLLIDANRYVRYVEQHPLNRQLETALSAEAHSGLVALFIEKDFLHLGSSYLNARVADAFHYRIIFRHAGAQNQVETDYYGAPPELQALVDRLTGVIDWLQNNSLALEFKTGADTLRHGDKLTLTLIATNRSANPLTLQFRNGQTFDFFATAQTAVTNAFSSKQVWNWAYDKAFAQVLRSETLQPGESRTYSAEWHGRSNDGDLVAGEFWLGARLVSLPGGYPPMRKVVVTP